MSLALFATVTAVIGIGYMIMLIFKVLRVDEGDERIKELVASIREGAEAFIHCVREVGWPRAAPCARRCPPAASHQGRR